LAVFNVVFEPLGKKGKCPDNSTILDCARGLGLGINNVCGGHGTCHSCKIRLLSGNASTPTASERGAFKVAELKNGWRLACQTYPQSDCRFEVPADSMTIMQRLQVEGEEVTVPVSPPVKYCKFQVVLPSLSDLEADADRILNMLNKQYRFRSTMTDLAVLRELPEIFRSSGGKLEAAVRGNEIIALRSQQSQFAGLAVDIGTTKIAVYIVDPASGKTLTSEGIMNPQVSYGDDIISRMTNAVKTPGVQEKLRKSVTRAINKTVRKLCSGIKLNPDQIIDAVIVGNTAMHHLFAGLPVKQLALSPFIPAASIPLDIKARDLGIDIHPGAYIHLLPNIAGFVGADHVAVLLAIDAVKIQSPTVVLDIGTNTEISLITGDKITSVSCASGPAFEGAHIKSGMRAANRAIERVQINGDQILYQTIGNIKPAGLCGSGLLDAMAQMFLSGIIDRGGRIDIKKRGVRKSDGVAEFILVEGTETLNKMPVVISQQDIRELQLAKAAIRSGIEVILRSKNIRANDLKEIIIAGAFGTYINPESAVTIGMLPTVPLNRFRQIGNAAGMGAKLALISVDKRREAKELLKKIQYIELAAYPDFMRIFMESNYLGKYRFDNNRREEIK